MRLTLSLSETFGAWTKWLAVSVVLLPACVALGTRRVIRYVRRHWLWRNTGFVKPLPSVVPRKVLILAVAVVPVSTAIGFTLPRVGWAEPMFLLRMLAAGVGWAQGVSAVGVGRTIGLSRWIWLGISGGLASTLFPFIHLTFGQTLLALCLLWGLAFAASGLVSLRCTLRPKTYGRANNV